MSTVSTTPRPRFVLVPSARPAAAGPSMRRYRLARLSVNPPRGRPPDRFDYLKRSYD